MPHTAFVQCNSAEMEIQPGKGAAVSYPEAKEEADAGQQVTFTVQLDVEGTNQWIDYASYEVAGSGAKSIVLPSDLNAVWMRVKTNRDCVATTFLHQTSAYPNAESAESNEAIVSRTR